MCCSTSVAAALAHAGLALEDGVLERTQTHSRITIGKSNYDWNLVLCLCSPRLAPRKLIFWAIPQALNIHIKEVMSVITTRATCKWSKLPLKGKFEETFKKLYKFLSSLSYHGSKAAVTVYTYHNAQPEGLFCGYFQYGRLDPRPINSPQ